MRRGERGNSLILVLLFAFLGLTLIIALAPLGATAIKSGKVYNSKANTLYAADAGIEDAKWQIKYDQLAGKFSTFDPHDYSTVWSYNLPPNGNVPQVNSQNVTVTISNVFIPQGLFGSANGVPDVTTANSIINNPKLMVTGGPYVNTSGIPCYNIVITYYPGLNENLWIGTIGVWLPPGYSYTPASSNLGSEPVTGAYQGGQSAVWNLNSLAFTALPGVSTTTSPETAKITFAYYLNGVTPASTDPTPDAVSWVNTSNVAGLSYTWDDTVRVFHVTSTAGSTTVETYVPKNELRKLGGALNGDYYATGNSLMRDLDGDGVKETQVNSSAVVAAPNPAGADNGVPGDANVSASYLYWGTWYISDYWAQKYSVSGSNRCHTLLQDTFEAFNPNWDNGSSWSVYNYWGNNYFRASGKNYPDTSPNRDLTAHSSFAFDLGTYPSPTWVFTLSWEQWYSGTAPGASDGLDFYLSSDGGVTWNGPVQAFRGPSVGTSGTNVASIYQYNLPVTYLTANFKIKFHVTGFNLSNQYVNIDDFRINALEPATGLTFEIDNGGGSQVVYFDANGNPAASNDPANKVVAPS